MTHAMKPLACGGSASGVSCIAYRVRFGACERQAGLMQTQEETMKQAIAIAILSIAALGLTGVAAGAAGEEANPAELAKALTEARVPLEQGLKASEREGRPISGKYEIDNGALQLSVYTSKGGQFSEVIVDHKSGAIKKAEKITDSDDLKEAKKQDDAMSKAKRSLETAVSDAVKANSGYRAVSVEPSLKGGQPAAEVTLMKGTDVKKVSEKLN